jgi:16S rRNA (guanine966-N2)-methyltransferase
LNKACEIRIIGGKYRSRKITFPELPDLRPTPNRIRETLFDWLQQDAVNAHCLDVFAGSGALGFEAMSRGAASIVFVEKDRTVIHALKRNAESLGIHDIQCIETDSIAWLNKTNTSKPFDVVFLDPPFSKPWLKPSLEALAAHQWLAPNAWIYIESAQPFESLSIPQVFEIYREKKAGQVHYGLLRYLTNI